MIENGEIVESGTFDTLINSNGSFSGFFKTYLSVKEANFQTTSKLIFLAYFSNNCYCNLFYIYRNFSRRRSRVKIKQV